jgi:methionyl aminopeptidase
MPVMYENLADTAEARKAHEKSGRVAAAALKCGARMIKPEASMREVLDAVEEYIIKHGCLPAFPAQSSINNVAAHFCPTDAEDVFYKDGDVVKLDLGAHYNGYVGDNAITISLGPEHKKLADVTREALHAAQGILRPGCTPTMVGEAIQETLAKHGFRPIRNLSGHGLGQFAIHTSPSMPNYPTGESMGLVEHQVVAIEPFGTDGTAGMIYNGSSPTVFGLRGIRPMRTQYGKDTMALISTYQGLPFTTRWLTRKLGSKALLGLSEMRRAGILVEYPPLLERSKGFVAQQENTFIITKNGCKVLTSDDD